MSYIKSVTPQEIKETSQQSRKYIEYIVLLIYNFAKNEPDINKNNNLENSGNFSEFWPARHDLTFIIGKKGNVFKQ